MRSCERFKGENLPGFWLNKVIKVDRGLPAALIVLYGSSSMALLQPAQQKEQQDAVKVGLKANKMQILESQLNFPFQWGRLKT